MRIRLISDRPDHPVLAEMMERLRRHHDASVLTVDEEGDVAALAAAQARDPASVYLLKSHTPAALELARRLELCGALVVNRWASTRLCQDRVLMSRRVIEAGLPWPRTWSAASLGRARMLLDELPFPVIVKSRRSRRQDLVCRVDGAAGLEALMPRWGGEPVILQEFADNDGWDIKVWAVGGRVFAARRRTPLDPEADRESRPVDPSDVAAGWAEMALRVGRAFGLSLYGVDLVAGAGGAVVIDVNAFPGYRGVAGAAAALATHVEDLRPGSLDAEASA